MGAIGTLSYSSFFQSQQCKPHTSLNTSWGIIRCSDLAGVSTSDIIEGLADQNVTNARRNIITIDGVKRETNTLILTFQTAIITKVLEVGYLKVPVDLYIPNPLQCYSRFKFGHHESRCCSSADSKLCRRCDEVLSNHPSPCANDCKKKKKKCKCVSCGGEHMVTSRTCPVWQREKEIVSVKYRKDLFFFQDARKVVNSRFILTYCYAMAAKGTQVKDAQTDVAVQTETYLKDSHTFSVKYHSCYLKHFSGNDKASGGVAVIVNNCVPHHSVNLDTTLQAVAVSISLNMTITLCSVYLPPSSPIDIRKVENLINQLQKPFILMGDFNSHHALWGCMNTNEKGRIIEDFITEHDLVLLNDKSSTYLHPATGSYSSLDLTLCSPGIFF